VLVVEETKHTHQLIGGRPLGLRGRSTATCAQAGGGVIWVLVCCQPICQVLHRVNGCIW
jgi:hypothetical protein